jgi:integrase
MVKLRLKYVVEDVDRHGKVRRYFRRRGKPKIPLPGPPGSAEFMAAYQLALEGKLERKDKPGKAPHGSFRGLVEEFYRSSLFKRLDARSQRVRMGILERFMSTGAEVLPYGRFEARHVVRFMDDLQDTPGAANNLLKALRHLFRFARKHGYIAPNSDPTSGVENMEYRKRPFHSWTMGEVQQFETRWAIGTKPRLALALLLYTGQRRSDIVALGRQHIKDGCLEFTQAKSRHYDEPVHHAIPILPDLQRVINATPSSGLAFLETQMGKPYTANGFGNAFRDWCDLAGLRHCSSHGLRKLAATKLAEAGCTPHQIMSITGHRTLAQVEHYTRAVAQRQTAQATIHHLKRDKD